MRIIAGEHRSRRLLSPEGLTTRPIPDRVKESVFSMLGARIDGASFLDAFAGSGSIGLEALSRGASSCVFVEMDKRSGATLEQNIAMLRCERRSTLVRGDALGLSLLARLPRPLDLAFFDPPYPMIRTPEGWSRVKQQLSAVGAILAPDGFLLVRTPWPYSLEVEVDEEGRPLGSAVPVEGERRRSGPPGKWDKKFKKGREGKRTKGRREYIEGVEITAAPQGLDRLEEEFADGFVPDEPEADGVVRVRGEDEPAVRHEAPDMGIEGCAGPETHAYGSTAVHWYMRRRAH